MRRRLGVVGLQHGSELCRERPQEIALLGRQLQAVAALAVALDPAADISPA